MISCSSDYVENEAVEESVDKEPTEIRIAYFATGSSAHNLKKVIQIFDDQNDDIDIEIIQSNYSDHHNKIKIGYEKSDVAEVFLLDSVYIPEYLLYNKLTQLNDFVDSLDLEEYLGFEQLKTYNEDYYGVPQGIQVDVLFYNKKMFDEAGVEYPSTNWNIYDLKEAAIRLTKEDQWGFALPNNNPRYGWYTLIRQFGGDILDEERRNSTIKTDPGVREAMKFMYDAWNISKYVPNFQDQEVLTDRSSTYFPREIVAMFYDSYVGTTRSNDALLDYDVVEQPITVDQYVAYIANCWVVPSEIADEELEAVHRFLKYYYLESTQLEIIEATSALPANKKALEVLTSDKDRKPMNKQAFQNALQYAETIAESVIWGEQKIIFEKYLSQYLKDEINLDEMLEKAHDEIQMLLDQKFN